MSRPIGEVPAQGSIPPFYCCGWIVFFAVFFSLGRWLLPKLLDL